MPSRKTVQTESVSKTRVHIHFIPKTKLATLPYTTYVDNDLRTCLENNSEKTNYTYLYIYFEIQFFSRPFPTVSVDLEIVIIAALQA